jgi:hypothetical protein
MGISASGGPYYETLRLAVDPTKAKGINQDSQNHLNIIYSYKYLESDLIKQSRDIYPFVGSTANRKVS